MTGRFVPDDLARRTVYVTLESAESANPPTGVGPVQPPDGVEYIAIKDMLSIAEQSTLEGATISADPEGGVQPDVERFFRVLCEVFVVDWRLLEDEMPVPFNRKQIGRLSADDPLVNKAISEIAKRNPTRRPIRRRIETG